MKKGTRVNKSRIQFYNENVLTWVFLARFSLEVQESNALFR